MFRKFTIASGVLFLEEVARADEPVELAAKGYWTGNRIDVHDEAGELVDSLSFADALEVVPPR
jgi:hypothetical protein